MTSKILLMSTLIFTSCASYVARMHHEIDKGNKSYRPRIARGDQFAQYRDDPRTGFRRGYVPKRLSSKNTKFKSPVVKRHYQNVKKRYKAEDLVDNDNSGNIWASNGQGSFLFSKNNYKRSGDIIIVKVQTTLKREISQELARAFPKIVPPDKKDGKKKDQEKKPASADQNAGKAKKDEDPNKIWDKISGVVIEEINKDHLLIRGRKDVLHQKSKRTIELQALVSRRDITDNDTVDSNSIIESNVNILR